MLRTDIPQELLPALVQLGLKVKKAGVSNIDLDSAKNFPTGRDPNYAAMRTIVQNALAPQPHRSARTSKRPATTQNLNDACAYHPGQNGA